MKNIIKILSLLAFYFLLGNSAIAGFTISGTTITQTGTDTDLSWLNGIAWVNVFTKGTKIVYQLTTTNIRLDVTWTLDMDPEIEELWFPADAITDHFRVQSGGLLRIGKATVIDGITRYSKWDVLVMPRDTTAQFTIGSLEIRNGGRFEWRGGTIYAGDAMGALSGGTAEIWDGRFVTSATSTGTNGSAMIMRNDRLAGDTIVHSVVLDSLNPLTAAPVVFSRNWLSTFAFEALAGFIQTRSGTTSWALVLRGIRFANNAFPIDVELNGSNNFTNTQGVEISNLDVGTAIRIDDNSNERGHMAIFQELNLTTLDANANPIAEVKGYISTSDSGNRSDIATWVIQNNRIFSTGVFDIYEEISNTSWVIPTIDVLTWRFKRNGSSPATFDFYSNSQVRGADDFTVFFASYNHSLTSESLILHSAESIDITINLLPDSSITETTRSIVSGYTEIDSSAKFYDRAKLYIYDNFVGQTETLVTKAGNNIDAGIYNVVVDATANDAFAFDGSTITIKATEFVGNIWSAWTVSFVNGASPIWLVWDSSGTTSLLTLTDLPADSYVLLVDNTGATHDYRTAQVWEYNVNIPATATGTWTYVVKKPWFIPQIASFTPVWEEYSFPVSLSVEFQSNGVVMYNGSTSTLIDIEFAGLTQLNIDIWDGAVTNQAIYDTVEQNLILENGMQWLASGKTWVTTSNLSSGSFIFLSDDVRFRRNTSWDVNATVSAFAVSTQWVLIDTLNGWIQFLTSWAADVSIGDADKESIAALVRTNLEADGWLLDQIYNLLQDVLTWLIWIKWDTQKIR